MRAAVIIVTIIVWLWVAARILEFGAVQDYAFLSKFNAQLVSFLQSINTYLWWAIVLLGTLIVYFFLSAWYSGSVQRAAYKTVPAATAAELIGSLSPEGRDVLGWVWRDRSEPINIGNLKTTKDELDNNRVSKLAQIREQERLLGPGTLVAADDRLAAALTTPQPPVVERVDAIATPPVREQAAPPASRQQALHVPAAAGSAAAGLGVLAASEPVLASEPVVTPETPQARPVQDQNVTNDPVAIEPVIGKETQPDTSVPVRDEPVLASDETEKRPTVSTSEQTEPTIGRPDDPHLRSPRDEVKHTIT